ncbi:MAG: porin, partial [bacterium]
VQNLGETNQLVVKYDVYDPNKDVSGDEIGQSSGAKLTAGDLKYSTLALGLVHYWSENVKFVLYYDMVQNEKSANLSAYKEDLKDNVVTFRVQYKF